jgi:outer membrane protein OmpA-like peptidoglycan-associated protein
MYYYLDESGTKGYLTSSRNTSTSQLESYEACCMDIYAVDIESEIDLDVLTFLQIDGSDLTGTKVCLIDEDTKKEICISNPNSTNLAQFKLLPNKNYRLIATKDGHTTATETFRTNPGDKKLVKKLYLLPPPMKLDVYTYLLPTKDRLDDAIVKLIDITDPNKPVEVIRTSKSNDFHFDILPNRQYKLVGTRDGYSQVLDMLNTKGMSGTITRDLYFQRRGMQEQLPISLYFDNDYPDPRSRSPKTGTQYNSLTDNYLARKQEYVTNFTKGLSSSESASAQVEIESFFSNDVEDGRYRFNAFLSSLEQQLAQGQSVVLEIRGFASPRAKSDYNKILSERRISCIRNQMMAYGNGAIKTAFAQGKLKLIDVSFGNTQAKPNVIGDLDDERNSIYNINAARERRVEIINAIIK